MFRPYVLAMLAAFTIAIPSASAFWSMESEELARFLSVEVADTTQPMVRLSLQSGDVRPDFIEIHERRRAFLQSVKSSLEVAPRPFTGDLR